MRITGRVLPMGTLEAMRRVAVLAVVVCGAIAVGSSLAANRPALRLVPVVARPRAPRLRDAGARASRSGSTSSSSPAGSGSSRTAGSAPRRSSTSARVESGGEQGLLGLAFRPGTPGRHVLRQLLAAAERRHGRRPLPAAQRAVVAGSASTILRVEQPYANHNGGHLAFGPTGGSGSGSATAARAATPRTARRTWTPCSGRCSASTCVGAAAAGDRRARAPQPVALQLRPADRVLWIGDVGQNQIEEIDRLARPGTGLVNFGWDVYEGTRFEDKALGAGPARPARRAVHPRRRAAR